MTQKTSQQDYTQKAWLVCTNQTDLKTLKFFKKGFRHCFIVIHDGAHWISVDPMSNQMEIIVHNVEPDFDLPSWLRTRGHKIIEAPLAQRINKAAPVMLFTCVEACKRILGIRNMLILTPWQLYQHILKQNFTQQKGILSWEA